MFVYEGLPGELLSYCQKKRGFSWNKLYEISLSKHRRLHTTKSCDMSCYNTSITQEQAFVVFSNFTTYIRAFPPFHPPLMRISRLRNDRYLILINYPSLSDMERNSSVPPVVLKPYHMANEKIIECLQYSFANTN